MAAMTANGNNAMLAFVFSCISRILGQGIVFGHSTLVANGFGFHMPNESLEVTCVVPSDLYSADKTYFEINWMTYTTASSEVAIVNETAIRLVLPINDSLTSQLIVECYSGLAENARKLYSPVHVYVSYGIALTNQSVRCITGVSKEAFESVQSKLTLSVKCNLTIDLAVNSYFGYVIHFGTTRDSRKWSYANTSQIMPIELTAEINSSSLFEDEALVFETLLEETLSGRTARLKSTIPLIETIYFIDQMLQWEPLSNGSGFRVSRHQAEAPLGCSGWTYYADIEIRTMAEHNSSQAKTFSMTCLWCDGCEEIVADLEPGTEYLILVNDYVKKLSTTQGSLLSSFVNSNRFHVTSEEMEPTEGPNIVEHYVITTQCNAGQKKCRAPRPEDSCRVINIYWQALSRKVARGSIIGYQVRVFKENITEEYIDLPASACFSHVCYDGSSSLTVAVAGRTAKGFPPLQRWSSLHINREITRVFGVTLRRIPDHTSLPNCSISWILQLYANESEPMFSIIYGERDSTCYLPAVTVNATEVSRVAWKSFLKYTWIPRSDHEHLCDSAFVAVAATQFGSAMSPLQFTEVDCVARHNTTTSVPIPMATVHAGDGRICITLSLLPGCESLGGPTVFTAFRVNLDGDFKSKTLEATLIENVQHYCFNVTNEQGWDYNASVQLAVDDGTSQPIVLVVHAGSGRIPGFTEVEKAGIVGGALLLTSFFLFCAVICANKARTYQDVLSKNLKILTIKPCRTPEFSLTSRRCSVMDTSAQEGLKDRCERIIRTEDYCAISLNKTETEIQEASEYRSFPKPDMSNADVFSALLKRSSWNVDTNFHANLRNASTYVRLAVSESKVYSSSSSNASDEQRPCGGIVFEDRASPSVNVRRYKELYYISNDNLLDGASQLMTETPFRCSRGDDGCELEEKRWLVKSASSCSSASWDPSYIFEHSFIHCNSNVNDPSAEPALVHGKATQHYATNDDYLTHEKTQGLAVSDKEGDRAETLEIAHNISDIIITG